jgi:hypothetical protein
VKYLFYCIPTAFLSPHVESGGPVGCLVPSPNCSPGRARNRTCTAWYSYLNLRHPLSSSLPPTQTDLGQSLVSRFPARRLLCLLCILILSITPVCLSVRMYFWVIISFLIQCCLNTFKLFFSINVPGWKCHCQFLHILLLFQWSLL